MCQDWVLSDVCSQCLLNHSMMSWSYIIKLSMSPSKNVNCGGTLLQMWTVKRYENIKMHTHAHTRNNTMQVPAWLLSTPSLSPPTFTPPHPPSTPPSLFLSLTPLELSPLFLPALPLSTQSVQLLWKLCVCQSSSRVCVKKSFMCVYRAMCFSKWHWSAALHQWNWLQTGEYSDLTVQLFNSHTSCLLDFTTCWTFLLHQSGTVSLLPFCPQGNIPIAGLAFWIFFRDIYCCHIPFLTLLISVFTFFWKFLFIYLTCTSLRMGAFRAHNKSSVSVCWRIYSTRYTISTWSRHPVFHGMEKIMTEKASALNAFWAQVDADPDREFEWTGEIILTYCMVSSGAFRATAENSLLLEKCFIDSRTYQFCGVMK